MFALHSARSDVREVVSLENAFFLADNDPDVYKITTEENGKRLVFWKNIEVCACNGNEDLKVWKGWRMTSRPLIDNR